MDTKDEQWPEYMRSWFKAEIRGHVHLSPGGYQGRPAFPIQRIALWDCMCKLRDVCLHMKYPLIK